MLKDDVQKLYKSDQQVATIYSAFAFIAIVISCLGLLGISLFDIRQRYREIAIRKVNGAMLKDLYVLLLRRYVGMLLLAAVVAVPLAWLAIHYYTADLVVKAPVTVGSVPDSLSDSSSDFCGYVALAGEQGFPYQSEVK